MFRVYVCVWGGADAFGHVCVRTCAAPNAATSRATSPSQPSHAPVQPGISGPARASPACGGRAVMGTSGLAHAHDGKARRERRLRRPLCRLSRSSLSCQPSPLSPLPRPAISPLPSPLCPARPRLPPLPRLAVRPVPLRGPTRALLVLSARRGSCPWSRVRRRRSIPPQPASVPPQPQPASARSPSESRPCAAADGRVGADAGAAAGRRARQTAGPGEAGGPADASVSSVARRCLRPRGALLTPGP